MLRSNWSGSISFGLINIPVKMVTAIKNKDLRFQQLRRHDGCRIRLKRICSSDGQEVPDDQIIKGYETSPGRYVTVSKTDLDSLIPKSLHTINIQDFVQLSEIDPLYIERSYYLAPDQGAGKAYFLLIQAMRKTGKVAIARVILHNKQYLVLLRPHQTFLAMSTMYFHDEIVNIDELGIFNEVEPDPRELAMAEQLITSLSVPFIPENYHDEYREKLLAMIEAKAEGQTVTSPSSEQPGKVVDLMAALEASIKARTSDEPGTKRKKKIKRKTAG